MSAVDGVPMEVMLGKPELTKAMEKFDTDPRDKRIAELESRCLGLRNLVASAYNHGRSYGQWMEMPSNRIARPMGLSEFLRANGLGEG